MDFQASSRWPCSHANSTTDGPEKLFFTTTLVASGIVAKVNDPPAPFTWHAVTLSAVYQSGSGPGSGISFEVSTSFSLNPREADLDKYSSASLSVDLNYIQGGSWSLSGSVENFHFGVLGGYFHKDLSDAFLDVLGKISIKSFTIDYTFVKTGTGTSQSSSKASSFVCTGDIVIGGLEFQLFYQYASSSVEGLTAAQQKKPANPKAKSAPKAAGKSEWCFEADLGASSPGATMGL
jgi:hypothetical protein